MLITKDITQITPSTVIKNVSLRWEQKLIVVNIAPLGIWQEGLVEIQFNHQNLTAKIQKFSKQLNYWF